jgi:hypothetical protein
MSNHKRFQWSQAENGWKDKSGKIIPFAEMTESQLKKTYKLASHKELVYYNKYMVFIDKKDEMIEEARKRGIELEELNTDFHRKNSRSSRQVTETC